MRWYEPENEFASHPSRPPRSAVRLLIDPVFGPFMVGKLASACGIWIHSIAAAILAYELSDSAFVVGLVTAFQFAPQLLLAPLSGAQADRGDRRWQIMIGRIVVSLGSGFLAAWILIEGTDGLSNAVPVMLTAVVVGTGSVIGGPAMNAVIPSMVRHSELSPAMSLNFVPITFGRVIGPAVGALIMSASGPALAFGVAAACNLAFALILVLFRFPRRVGRQADKDLRFRAGLQRLRRDPTLVRLLVGIAAVSIGSDPAITLAPPLSATFGGGTDLVGLFASAFGAGAIFVFPLIPIGSRKFGEAWLATFGLCLLAAGLLALSITPTPLLAIISFAVAGAGMVIGLTSLSTQIQLRVPDHLRGRVMALWAVAFLGSRPMSSAFDGWIADALSVEVALITVGLVVAMASWLSRPSQIQVPSPEASE